MNIVIVGAGEVGRYLAETLSKRQHNICVVERTERLAVELNERLDVRVMNADGASVATLAEANVAESDLFLALTSDDTTNLVAASLAKALGARKTIARVHTGVQREEWLFDYRAHFGIDYLFSSERLAAIELAKHVHHPEHVMVEELARGRIEIQQVQVDAKSDVRHVKLQDLGLPERVRIASILRQGQYIIPTGQDTVETGDLVTLFGEPAAMSRILPRLDPDLRVDREVNVVIFGGGGYGFALAQMLESKRTRVRIFERDPKLCQELSNLLQRTVVLQADATSLTQLREEQVGAADFFIATSNDDEDNVMTCLQAKSLGTRYCLALIHRADYADVIVRSSEQLGIIGAVSPREATNRDLLRFVTEEKFHVIMKLSGGAEVLEAVVRPAGSLAGKKIAEVKWPAGAGLVGLLHGQQAIVPKGDDLLEPGDTLYAIVAPAARKAFIKLLAA